MNKHTVVVDTSSSPHAKLSPVSVNSVKLTDSFWEPRREINRRFTLYSQYQHLIDTNTLANLDRASGKSDKAFAGMFFADSDVYKWLEAASWELASNPDSKLEKIVDETITLIASAQSPDGYLDSYFTFEREKERWSNLRDLHELYCAGHYIQAAVAHYRSTGKTSALDIATKLADCICKTFGDGEGQLRVVDGHEEIELALVELYRATQNAAYLKQAQYFIDLRGHHTIGGGEYHQDHVPIREMSEITGHAVRAVYHTSGVADIYAETGESALLDALNRLWDSTTLRKMYVTGGIGSRYEGEAFGADYELPNSRAYTETCAAIGLVMWAWRMLQITRDSKFADVIELALYNGVLSGLSLSGDEYFYPNPLADNGKTRRSKWFGCACCPPNVARTLSSLPGYFYSQSKDDGSIWVHLYADSVSKLTLGDTQVTLTQKTSYPWSGTVNIEVGLNKPASFAIRLRVPNWSAYPTVSINSEPSKPAQPGTYETIEREWKSGDTITLDLGEEVRQVVSHPSTLENNGRVALTYGPLVYCVEAVDNPGIDLAQAVVDLSGEVKTTFASDVLNGVVTLSIPAQKYKNEEDWDSNLYKTSLVRSSQTHHTAPGNDVTIKAVPYYAWANREAGQMQVWLKTHK